MTQYFSVKLIENLAFWCLKAQTRRWMTYGLVIMGPILLILTISALRSITEGGAGLLVRGLILLDLIYTIVIISLICLLIARVFNARGKKLAGSQLHMRLVSVFVFLALVPTVLVAVFAALIFIAGLEVWFSDRVGDVVVASLAAAEAYEDEQRKNLEEDILFLATLLNDIKHKQPLLAAGDVRVILSGLQQSLQRGIKEAYVINGLGELVARGELSYLFDYEHPTAVDIIRADHGEIVVIQDWANNEFRALIRLTRFIGRYLYISRLVDGEILSLLDNTKETVQFYNQMESQRERLLFDFGLIYLVFACIIILLAMWIGLIFAERLSRPIAHLAAAAQRLGTGDFNVRVVEQAGGDEISILGRVFNKMIGQVKQQRDDLMTAHQNTERRRRLFDGVLSGVTAGVIGLTPNGHISLINRAAENLLNLDANKDINKKINHSIPEFANLFNQIKKTNNVFKQEQININNIGDVETLLVRIAQRRAKDSTLEGYVITFDDITDLLSAQRLAAWGDVAQRIAHEVKNPLTPIQLSAERVSRKFAPLLGEEGSKLREYTDVIVRQTNDLRRIVDEFSRFARMPHPRKTLCDLTKLLKNTIVLHHSEYDIITLTLDIPDNALWVEIDVTMMSQVLLNLIKNAKEAIEEFLNNSNGADYKPEIRILLQIIRRSIKPGVDHSIEIKISDNGIGLPKDNRSRLFEPYVTLRSQGTGLGLSIVKKIVEEHAGILELRDSRYFSNACSHRGTTATVLLPFDKFSLD